MSDIGTLIERWYQEMWNPWHFQVRAEIAHSDLQMRGSLGRQLDEAERPYYRHTLGDEIAFEWPHAPGFPVFVRVMRDGTMLHLSEHTGDANFGSNMSVEVDDVDALYAEVTERGLQSPEPVSQPWKWREFCATDPDGNRIRFITRTE